METKTKQTKFVRVPAYTKTVCGHKVKVPAHVRSTPCACPTSKKR